MESAYFNGRNEKSRTSGLLVPNQSDLYINTFSNFIKTVIDKAFEWDNGILWTNIIKSVLQRSRY